MSVCAPLFGTNKYLVIKIQKYESAVSMNMMKLNCSISSDHKVPV